VSFNKDSFVYAEISEIIYNAKEEAKYIHLLEGHTYAQLSELWFNALNK
jgi:hypothetical protein